MEDRFLKHWFSGFESAITKLDADNRTKILRECGRACSDSYSKEVFREAFQSAVDFNDFLTRLKESFMEMQIDVIEENKTFIIIYTACACDLHTKGYLHTGQLCECSQLSLKDNLEAVIGEGRVKVTLKESILKGNERCKLLVEIDPEQ